MKPLRFLPALAVLLLGCAPSDRLEQAALAASRAGTIANYRDGNRGGGIEAAGRVAARYYWVKKYEASPQQRAVATERAQTIVRNMEKRRTKPKSRYIAVVTQADSRASTATPVMLFDTQSRAIVGNSVYDVNERPPKEQAIRFETYSASYVGTGP